MVVNALKQTLDLDHADYLKRQWFEVSLSRVEACAQAVRPAHHFKYNSGDWSPMEYEGFAVVSMVDDSPINSFLSYQLQDVQDELLGEMNHKSLFALPRASFHQTVANTLSDIRFKNNIVSASKEDEFPEMVATAFRNIPIVAPAGPVRMKLIGLSIFNTAIGVLGIIESPNEYKKITSFRTNFYSDPHLASLDVKMTRPFIGHVTLAYIEKELSIEEKTKLANTVNGINDKVRDASYYFVMSSVELRRYHHLAAFHKNAGYPSFQF